MNTNKFRRIIHETMMEFRASEEATPEQTRILQKYKRALMQKGYQVRISGGTLLQTVPVDSEGNLIPGKGNLDEPQWWVEVDLQPYAPELPTITVRSLNPTNSIDCGSLDEVPPPTGLSRL